MIFGSKCSNKGLVEGTGKKAVQWHTQHTLLLHRVAQ